MNAEQLFRNFERVADAPEAIPRFRRFVLDLAVRGRLLPQGPVDESAQSLIHRIELTKLELIRAGHIRQPRERDADIELAEPFDLPGAWCWVRLDAVGAIIGGGTPPAGDPANFAEPGDGTPWLTPADLGGRKGLYVSRGARDLSEDGLRSSSASVMPAGSVLFTSRAPIGYIAIASNPVATNQGFKSVVPYLMECSRYVALVMQAFAPEIDARASGTTFKEVSGKIVAGIPFPLPPLAEQHRIVAKVDELMTLCDRLESARTEREVARDRLTVASLARLDATDSATCREYLQFALEILPALTARSDQLIQLRRAVLNLGVRGLLTTPIAGEGGAAQLLASIQKWKLQLGPSATKKKPGGNGMMPVLDESAMDAQEGNFALPIQWCWASASSVCERIESGSTPPAAEMFEGSGDVPFIKVYNLTKSGQLNFSVRPTFVSYQTHAGKLARSRIRPGDVLMNIVGPPLGKVSVVPDTHPEWNTNQAVVVFRPAPGIVNRYLAICLMSDAVLSWIAALAQQTVGQVNISVGKCRRLPIPIPTTSEQMRIVAKVDELLALCDQLEVALTASEGRRLDLLESLLHETLERAGAEEEVA